MQTGFFHTAVDILDGILITGDDVEVGADLYTAITDRVRDILKIIYRKFLWYHINDLVAGRNIGFVLIIDQLINFLLGDLFFGFLANDITTGLQAFDMMTGNADIYFVYIAG